MFSIVAFGLSSALMASAASWNISVGFNNGLVYNPSSVNAQVGDILAFTFLNKNHSATQSTFAAPCTPMPGGIDSGFQPVSATDTTVPVWSVMVNSTDPLWFFCAQTNPVSHCNMGMVLAVNPTVNKTFAAFQAAAQAAGGATPSGATPSGGASGGGASDSATDVIPPPTSLPTGTGASGAVGSGLPSASSDSASGTNAPNPSASGAAVSLSPTGALSVASLLAAVAGFML